MFRMAFFVGRRRGENWTDAVINSGPLIHPHRADAHSFGPSIFLVEIQKSITMTVAKSSDAESKKPKVVKKLTKRQKRKLGPNPANTWQQQPKLKSTAARNKAYLHNAGLASKKAPAEKLNPDLDVINSPEYKFGRLLASPNARTRHATVKKLEAWLKARTDTQVKNGGLTSLDLLKLWKGLWHTLYLCDGVVVQEEVSTLMVGLIWAVGGTLEEDEYAGRFYLELEEKEEAEQNVETDEVEEDGDDEDYEQDEDAMEDELKIIEMEESDEDEDKDEDIEDDVENPALDHNQKHCRGAHLSALFVRTYFQTLSREWSNMDKYRIDKFYTLTRLFMREIYRYMASRHWNLGIIRLFNDALFEEVLKVRKYGNGIRFHVLDICLEELAKVNLEVKDGPGLPLTEAIFMDCLEPFFAMAQRVEDKIVHDRVLEKVMLRFLNDFSVVSDNFEVEPTSDESDSSKLVLDQVHVGTVAKFLFEIASDENTLDCNRTQLYDMHKTYMKRIKAVGRDVNLDYEQEDDDVLGEEGSTEKEVSTEDVSTLVEEEKEEGKNAKDTPQSNPPEKKKSKKSKKKKKNNVEVKESEIELGEHESHELNTTEKTKAGKKKKDNQRTDEKGDQNTLKKEKEASNNGKDDENKDNNEKSTRKKKKKKKKRKHEVESNDDEVITISLEDQKIAAAAVAKAMAKVNDEEGKAVAKNNVSDSDRSTEDLSKKVKFKTINKAKSYKASMKDLKLLDAKATLDKTPEKSILLASKRVSCVSEGKAKRRKKKNSRKSL